MRQNLFVAVVGLVIAACAGGVGGGEETEDMASQDVDGVDAFDASEIGAPPDVGEGLDTFDVDENLDDTFDAADADVPPDTCETFEDFYPDPDGDGFYGPVPAPVQPSCAAWLAAGATSDGVYTVDPDGEAGTEALEVFCDMTTDGGGWTRVFHHDVAGGYWADDADALERSVEDPLALRYSILSRLEALRSSDGSLDLRIDWPDSGVPGRNIWRQTSNPTIDAIAGYVPVDIDYTANGWGGLERNIANAASFIDGSVGIDYWFYAIGSTVAWSEPPGIPAHAVPAARVSLWVRPDDAPETVLETPVTACGSLEGYANVGGDCATQQPAVHPQADEVCDGIDNDCDGAVDEDCPAGDVSLTSLPQALHFYPRDPGTGLCTVLVEGETLGAADEVRVSVTSDGAPYAEMITSDAAFSVEIPIDAGLHLYSVTVEWDHGSGWWKPVATVDEVVCGDVFLIDGQSNAVAIDYQGEGVDAGEVSPFVRSFGSSVNDASVVDDLDYGVAVAGAGYTHAAIGQWGLRLARQVVETQGIPVLVINGAVGGTMVAQHQRNDADPTDLTTIYGRLLWRVQAAGLNDAVRGIFWHQGESDGAMAFETYLGLWTAMVEDWLEDYPNVEGIYPFQVRAGCGDPTWNRNVHRELPELLPMVKGNMSTLGVDGHDGCHFYHSAYVEWGDRMARLVNRDLYGTVYLENIEAPDPEQASWSTPTELVIDFGATGGGLILQPGAEQFFTLSDGASIVDASIVGEAVVLTTAAPSAATWVSFVDIPGDIPWLVNDLGIGSFAWYQLPITP